MTRWLSGLIVLTLLFPALGGCGKSKEKEKEVAGKDASGKDPAEKTGGDKAGTDKGVSKTIGGKTPEEAFATAMADAKAAGMKGLMRHTTAESQKLMAGTMAMQLGMFKAMAGIGDLFTKDLKDIKIEEPKLDLKPVGTLLAKHGLDEKVIMNAMMGAEKEKDPKAILSVLGKIAAPVKDPAAFVGEAVDVMKTLSKIMPGDNPFDELISPDATLKSVKISGDSARGKVTTAKGEEDIYFALEGGVWKIDIVPLIQEGMMMKKDS